MELKNQGIMQGVSNVDLDKYSILSEDFLRIYGKAWIQASENYQCAFEVVTYEVDDIEQILTTLGTVRYKTKSLADACQYLFRIMKLPMMSGQARSVDFGTLSYSDDRYRKGYTIPTRAKIPRFSIVEIRKIDPV